MQLFDCTNFFENILKPIVGVIIMGVRKICVVETMEYFTHLARDADTFLYGRKTYQLMVPYWPDVAKNPSGDRKADIEFARAFDAINKIIVFSQSLDRAEGKKTRIVRTNLQDEILKLKQEQGKNILTGGVTIPSQLAELGLIDEYHFVVHPIVIGGGRRLFEGINLQEKLQLKLVEPTVLSRACCASVLETMREKSATRAMFLQSSQRDTFDLAKFRADPD